MTDWGSIPEDIEYAGSSPPMAMVRDPSWFFFRYRNNYFGRWGLHRATEIVAKARSIVVAGGVAYELDIIRNLNAVRRHRGGDLPLRAVATPDFDFGVIEATRNMKRDRREANAILLEAFKTIVMGDKTWRLTEKRIQEFFDTATNFSVQPSHQIGFMKVRRGFWREPDRLRIASVFGASA